MKQLAYLTITILVLAFGCKKIQDTDPDIVIDEIAKDIQDTLGVPWMSQYKNFLDSPNFAGKFKGTIVYGSASNPHTSPSEVIFGGSNHGNANIDPARGYENDHPAGAAAGIFELKPGRIIKFIGNPRPYHALFETKVVLTGEYYYKAKGDSLILHKILPYDGVDGIFKIYQHRLKRVASPE